MARRPMLRGARSDRGVVLPLTALMLTTIILMVSFAVDLGRLRAERRDLQADADAIALDAVQKIGGKTSSDALDAAKLEADASALRNGFPAPLPAGAVKVGFWSVEKQDFCEGRWEFDTTSSDWLCRDPDAADLPDAVKVVLSSTIPMHFDLNTDDRSVTREAVAVARAQTKGELGSVFIGIDPTLPALPGCTVGVALSQQFTFTNYIYTELLGITAEVRSEARGSAEVDESVSCPVLGPEDGLQLDAISYRGLGFATVRLDELAGQMGFASADELMNAQVTQKEVLVGAARALEADGDTAAVDLAGIADKTVDRSETFDFGDAFAGQIGNGTSAAGATINALDLMVLTATAIDGKNFIGADTDFFLPVPGLGDVKSRIHVIESPKKDLQWKFQGEAGPRTSQVTVALEVPLEFVNEQVDLSDLSFLGAASTATVNGSGTLPIVVEVGHANSWYPRITCGVQGESGSIVDMRVNSGAVRVSIGALGTGTVDQDGDVTTPTDPLITAGDATVHMTLLGGDPLLGLVPTSHTVTVPLSELSDLTTVPLISRTFGSGNTLDVTGDYELNAGGGTESHEFVFTPPGPTDYWRYRGGLSGVNASGSVVGAHTFTSGGTLGTLLQPSETPIVEDQIVNQLLQPYLDTIDTTVLEPLLKTLGATAAGADGRIHGVRCQIPALANQG